MAFIHENFLLSGQAARRLYHAFAASEPILDYHNHLPPKELAENRRFRNLTEIWLEGDHYKWRAMRANGVPEELCTGPAEPYQKFLAWARTVPHTLRNPLYHWTHLELKRYFGIEELLDETTAPAIWARTSEMLATDELSVHGILRKFQVKALCTTDDPIDDLRYHARIAKNPMGAIVLPAFRPDKALNVHAPELYNPWLDSLGEAAGLTVRNFQSLLDALGKRHDYFHSMGSRLSDHGLNCAPPVHGTENEAADIFERARNGQAADPAEQQLFAGVLMRFFGHLDAGKGWTKQLHLGARRGNNTRMVARLGPDTGFDSIGDYPQIDALGNFLNALDSAGSLPRMILYNLNPSDNYAMATMVGNFMDGSIAGRIQFGSGWWFLDQKEAMEWQMNALSNCGLLSRFVGMLTDSRSFMSYPRHEYFRRTLCNLIGQDIEAGLLPDSDALAGPMIRNICFANAKNFLGLPGVE